MLRQHLPPRPELGVAVGVGLHDARVDAERGVVDEDASVETSEVDAPLDAVDERVERADDVVPVEPEVEREVVARPGRDADVGDVVLHGNARDQRLRPVTSCHSDDVGAPSATARFGEIAEVVIGAEEQRLDPALSRFLHRLKRSAFPPPDLGLMISTPLSGRLQPAVHAGGRVRRVGVVAHRVAGDETEEQQRTTSTTSSWYFWSYPYVTSAMSAEERRQQDEQTYGRRA